MSRCNPNRDVTAIFEAAQHWKKAALLGGGSVLSGQSLWTQENLDQLQRYYVDNLDYGEGTFLDKLEVQMVEATPAAKQLLAEIKWVMLLCPSNIGPENKRQNVKTIWEWSGSGVPDSPYLNDEVLIGIGSAGTAFNTQRWRELRFFVWFLQAFWKLPQEQQRALLESDGWPMAEWIEEIPEADSRQLRHMLLYLLFPDTFERIFGRYDRTRLLKAFTSLPNKTINKLSALEMSREIQRVRKEQEEIAGTSEIDFYWPPLSDQWVDKKPEPKEKPVKDTAFTRATADIQRVHVLEALEEIDESGVPGDARSTTYDLIHKNHRYPPKLVLSLAAKAATGELFPRDAFGGGESSEAFKFLRALGFHIERKDFLSELIRQFIEQANEASDLTTRQYPKKYRGLDVKVSFGQGRFTHVPWISYTGYGQSTSHGIYPVVLYYKSIGALVVAYGISETEKPEQHWDLPDQPVSVKRYLEEHFSHQPERYGASMVHTAFDINEEVDYEAIEAAIDDVISQYHEQLGAEDPITDPETSPDVSPYTLVEALADLFIAEEKFEEILDLLKVKKNLILQGAPGVGKTFASKRIAYTLMGEKDPDRLGMVQFHQSYSYEDFIQGYRPSGQGLRLRNGIFYEFCELARNDPSRDYVFIIDELNRANLSKVFGELMLLIETDKRGKEWAIQLAYAEEDSPKFYIPENLYLIGLMNTADRSLAMVDYALRRRFAFCTLEPGFETEQFFDYLLEKQASRDLIAEIVERMGWINREIAKDTVNLGPGFCIGHSFFCEVPDGMEPDWDWYLRVIQSEIRPLLNEYYFDAPATAESLATRLLEAPG